MQETTESPTRKRQRGDAETVGSAFDPVETTMNAENFSIPTITRSDIDDFSSTKSRKQDDESSSPTTPTVGDAIYRAFEKYQAIYLPQFLKSDDNTNQTLLGWKDLSGIFEKLKYSDKDSFCIENETAKSFKDDEKTSGNSFMKEKAEDNRVGYCSFMVQNDEEALSGLLDKLPVKDPIKAASDDSSEPWGYEPCLWIFFGRNHSNKDLDGRPEHTDQISHDGTWHFQLSGTKRWLLRPTPQLLRSWRASGVEDKEATDDKDENEIEPKQMTIDCRQGDVLIVNTRLWRHQTILPPQTEPSVSYARDFWIDPNKKKSDSSDAAAGAMTNVDGLYAMDDIEQDTVIFRENEMPECELHRSADAAKANCKVVRLEAGVHAVVSSKFIQAGEFFCLPESDDEEEEEDSEGEEEWFELGDDVTCIVCPSQAQ